MRDLIAEVRGDQRRQRAVGRLVLVESYLDRHPELGGDSEAVLDLIYAEVLLREEFGETVTVDEYIRRFPSYTGPLIRQFEVHTLLYKWSDVSSGTPAAVPNCPAPDIPGYRLARVLGAGAWGIVYDGVQLSIPRPVAVKVSWPGGTGQRDFAAILRREAEWVARVQHPHVVTVYDAGETPDGRAFIAMELVLGGNLASQLTGGPLDHRKAAEIVRACAAGVAAAHACGVVHRDLKPANVLLTEGGEPKVTDFGLARWAEAISLSGGQGLVGTAGYMAPEAQEQGPGVGPPADVFALGVILHETLTGRSPFRGDGLVDTLRLVRTAQPPDLPRGQLPRDLDAIRLKCLEKRPGDRYPTAAELAADLDGFLAGRPVVARRRGWLARTWRRVRGNLLPTAFLPAIVFGAALAVLPRTLEPAAAVGSREPEASDRWPTLGGGRMGVLDTFLAGPPRSRWTVVAGGLARAEAVDGRLVLETLGTGLLELGADPGCDRYRLSVRLQHVAATDDSRIGLYFGFRQSAMTDGVRQGTFFTLSYADRGRVNDSGVASLPTVGQATAQCHGFDDTAGVTRVSDGLGGMPLRFPPDWPPGRPSRLREMVVEVGPDGIDAYFGEEPGRSVPVVRFASHVLDQYAAEIQAVPPARPEDRTGYHPRAAFGIYVNRGATVVTQVRFDPLP